MNDKIELISPDLLGYYDDIKLEIDYLASALRRELGWHYILDLIWILKEIEELGISKNSTIIDAGAGKGILQYLLANRGYNVISVDFASRHVIIPHFLFTIRRISNRTRYENPYISHLASVGSILNRLKRLHYRLKKNSFSGKALVAMTFDRIAKKRNPGKIYFYQSDMRFMDKIKEESIDVVVSLSAIEHMKPEFIIDAIKEFKRVLKSKSPMVISTSAARDDDWFHNPSKGWCFCDKTLKRLFDISSCESFDHQHYDAVMQKFVASQDLQKRLSSLYFVSGDNGMPWGEWNPKYIPVGIVKYNQ